MKSLKQIRNFSITVSLSTNNEKDSSGQDPASISSHAENPLNQGEEMQEGTSEEDVDSDEWEENIEELAEQFKNNRYDFFAGQRQRENQVRQEAKDFAAEVREDLDNLPIISSRTRSSTPSTQKAIEDDKVVLDRNLRGVNNTTQGVQEIWEEWDSTNPTQQNQSPIDYVLEKQQEELPDYSDDLD